MNQLIINLIVGSSLLLSFLIFINPNQSNKKGNFWLGCFIFCLFLINMDEFLVLNKIMFFKEHQILILSFPLFVVAPIFSFSIIYFVNPTKKWRNVNYLHFLFGVFFTIFSYQYIYFQEDKLYVKNDQGSFHEWINIILIFVILPLQALYYIGKSYFYIRNHKKNINQFSSNTKDINLKWLENILYFIAVLGMLFVVDIATHKIDFLNLALLLCIFYIGFYTIKQKEIFPFTQEKTEEIIEFFTDKIATDSEKKLLLTQDKVSEIKEKISKIMESDKVFLNPDINLIFLANLLDISTHSLSFVLNQGFNENFNQFVNRHRIEEAKKIIVNPTFNYLSISGIAFEVGFNSKSVFNTTFKKLENCTPLQFKNQKLKLKISSEL